MNELFEIWEYGLLYIPFLGAAWLLRIEGHVKMEMVIDRLNPKRQSVLNTITSIIGVIIFLVMTWYGAKSTWFLFQSGHYMPTDLKPPTFLIILIIPAGSLLLFIQSLRRTHGFLRSRSSGHDESLGSKSEDESMG